MVPGASAAAGRKRPARSRASRPQLDVNTATPGGDRRGVHGGRHPQRGPLGAGRSWSTDPTRPTRRGRVCARELGKYNIDPVVLEQIIAVIDGVPDVIPAASGVPAASAAATIAVNTATQEEIAAAFTAAGIRNADRWAREVVEYRPYEADPTWARLREELGKYNIDPAVLEQIIALLRV